ncbi:hypothetical protein [Dietzia cinnamea]|uniref:DUF4157 domain-containing protein n=2 Tax=Dietzia TaxID=37914 RepID=A0A4R3ZSH9_9ACTN|nr:hypothetical protein [Dietzia cinnamea]PWD96115.1 hypothetical protein DEQ16_07185 [Dietzia maris]MBM7229845.1 hypothetical protein [Dietzia cinnamea]MCT1864258.1 hypothetical protein [Dietzia cinnamea]MCT2028729.1 hypothetical protein [Dietzia cinnamea]MCT2032216.1 hypothetical protein [Dietzia cinnamea]
MARTPVPVDSAGRVPDALGRALAAVARAADRRLDALGLAPPPLDLPPGVRTDLRAFFAGTVDPTAVTIRRGHVPGIPHPRAFALPGLIYLGADPGVVGIAGLDGTVRPRATPTLVHELVHIWQGRFLGPRYVVRALGEQIRLGRRAYDWRAVLDQRAALPVEAHAQLVSDAYAARYGPPRQPALSGRDEHLRAVEEVLSGLRAGDASTLRGRTV